MNKESKKVNIKETNSDESTEVGKNLLNKYLKDDSSEVDLIKKGKEIKNSIINILESEDTKLKEATKETKILLPYVETLKNLQKERLEKNLSKDELNESYKQSKKIRELLSKELRELSEKHGLNIYDSNIETALYDSLGIIMYRF